MNAGRLTTFGSDAVLLRSVSVRSDLAADVVAGRFTTTLPKRPTIGPPNLFGYWPTLEGWAGADSIGGYVVRELDGRRQPRLVAHTAFTGTVAPTDRGSLVTVEIAHIGARRLAIWRVALWVV